MMIIMRYQTIAEEEGEMTKNKYQDSISHTMSMHLSNVILLYDRIHYIINILTNYNVYD